MGERGVGGRGGAGLSERARTPLPPIKLESVDDVKQRCVHFRDKYRLDQQICIITHTNWIRFFLEINGYELVGERLGNCQMIEIDL